MIKSLFRYFTRTCKILFLKRERTILFRHAYDWLVSGRFTQSNISEESKQQGLEEAILWLLSAQRNMTDKGFGTYYIVEGWTTSYPETSGYIIPTLWKSTQIFPQKKDEIKQSIIECADWLLSIQKPSGGWQSAYVEHNRPEVVFNTGQVLRGLITVYEITGEQKYLDSMIKACDWLCATQEEHGSWVKTAYMQQARVYDSYVAHPLLLVYNITQNESYLKAVIKNLDWIVNEQQQPNAWFKNADNTMKHNEKPILHTISYTIDGLVNCGIILNDKRYIYAGIEAADKLLDIFNQTRYLKGRYNSQWKASDYIICTGCAQISIIWSLIYNFTRDKKYLKAISAMNKQLIHIQQSVKVKNGSGNGALPGSFPLWGKYEPFGFPNWATKYLADALMDEMDIVK